MSGKPEDCPNPDCPCRQRVRELEAELLRLQLELGKLRQDMLVTDPLAQRGL